MSLIKKILPVLLIVIYISVSLASVLNTGAYYFPGSNGIKIDNKKTAESKNKPVWTLRKHVKTIAKVSISAAIEVTKCSFLSVRKYIHIKIVDKDEIYIAEFHPGNADRAPPC